MTSSYHLNQARVFKQKAALAYKEWISLRKSKKWVLAIKAKSRHNEYSKRYIEEKAKAKQLKDQGL